MDAHGTALPILNAANPALTTSTGIARKDLTPGIDYRAPPVLARTTRLLPAFKQSGPAAGTRPNSPSTGSPSSTTTTTTVVREDEYTGTADLRR